MAAGELLMFARQAATPAHSHTWTSIVHSSEHFGSTAIVSRAGNRFLHATGRLRATCLGAAAPGLVAIAVGVQAQNGAFSLSSPDIANGKKIAEAQVFNSFGCTGSNLSPALSWSNAPAGTKSFALLSYEPDAPTGSGWWHWVAYNI